MIGYKDSQLLALYTSAFLNLESLLSFTHSGIFDEQSTAVNRKLKLLTFLLSKQKLILCWIYIETKRTLSILVSLFTHQKERFFWYDVEISNLYCNFWKRLNYKKVATFKKNAEFSQNLLYWFKICQTVVSRFYRNSHFHIEIQSSQKICSKHGFDFCFLSSIFKICK